MDHLPVTYLERHPRWALLTLLLTVLAVGVLAGGALALVGVRVVAAVLGPA